MMAAKIHHLANMLLWTPTVCRKPVPPVKETGTNRLRGIRFAKTLRISGEALRVVVTLREPEGQILSEVLSRDKLLAIRKAAAREAKRIRDTRKYSIDRMVLSGPSILFYIHAHDPSSAGAWSSWKEDQGERWVVAVDDFQEKLRNHIKRELKHVVASAGADIHIASSWEPGEGIIATGGIAAADADSRLGLEEELWSLRIQQGTLKSQGWRAVLALALGPIAILLLWVIWVQFIYWGVPLFDALVRSLNEPLMLIGALYVLLFFAVLCAFGVELREMYKHTGEHIREVLAKIDLLGVTDEKQKHAYKLFQLNNGELKRYYDQARKQRAWVFLLGIASILAGFVVIIWAIRAITALPPDAGLEEKIVIAILGGVGGILANFVAVIFLKMFSDIVASTVEFHLRLVGTHHAHFGNVLAARIQNDDLADETLGKLAIALASPGLGTVDEEAPKATPGKKIDSKKPA